MKFVAFLNRTSMKVRVLPEKNQGFEDYVEVGQFEVNTDDASGPKFNKVLYNEIQELLYQTGIQNMQKVEISVSPEAYEQANGAFLPQNAATYGNQNAPTADDEENTENSTQVRQARGKAAADRKKPAVEKASGKAVDPATLETPPADDPNRDPKPVGE